MLEVFQDLHDEDGVIIEVIADDSEKCLNIANDDLSGYMI